jgi:hypothetical protein
MCKTPCCPPQHSSGPGAIVAVIGVIIAVSVIRAILGLLELLAVITLITVAATAVVALAIWAVKHHRESAAAASYTLQQTRRAPALPPRYVVAIGHQPADRLSATTTPRALTSQHEHAVRRFADVIASYDDPAAVDDLIHRALRGPDTQAQLPRGPARTH